MKTGPSLEQLQRFVHWVITNPRGHEVLTGDNPPEEIRRWLTGWDWKEIIAVREGQRPGTRRLDVYSGAYPTRVFESLSEMYPAIQRVLGDQAFLSLGGRYVQRYPSTDYNLSNLGLKLPEFLAEDLLTESLPFLPDLADLERAVIRAFHAWTQPALDLPAISAIDPEKLGECRLGFQPETRLVSSRWPVVTIRENREMPDSQFRVQVEGNPERAIVHRTGYEVAVRKLDEMEYSALLTLLEGRTIWEALEALPAGSTDAPPPVEGWFRSWVTEGLLCRIG